MNQTAKWESKSGLLIKPSRRDCEIGIWPAGLSIPEIGEINDAPKMKARRAHHFWQAEFTPSF